MRYGPNRSDFPREQWMVGRLLGQDWLRREAEANVPSKESSGRARKKYLSFQLEGTQEHGSSIYINFSRSFQGKKSRLKGSFLFSPKRVRLLVCLSRRYLLASLLVFTGGLQLRLLDGSGEGSARNRGQGPPGVSGTTAGKEERARSITPSAARVLETLRGVLRSQMSGCKAGMDTPKFQSWWWQRGRGGVHSQPSSALPSSEVTEWKPVTCPYAPGSQVQWCDYILAARL